MENELYDKVERELWTLTRHIQERLVKNLEIVSAERNIDARLAETLRKAIVASVSEGYHEAFPTFNMRLRELVPPNNIPLIMETLPRRSR